jgi:hypothetical protein
MPARYLLKKRAWLALRNRAPKGFVMLTNLPLPNWLTLRAYLTKGLALGVIAFSLYGFFVHGVARPLAAFGHDFFFFYTVGQAWNEGRDVYDRTLLVDQFNQMWIHFIGPDGAAASSAAGNGYPPEGVLLFSLLARLPLATAYMVLVGAQALAMLAVVGLLGVIVSRYRKIGLVEAALLFSFLNTSFVRVSFLWFGVSCFVGLLLLLVYIFWERGQTVRAGLFLGLAAFKISFLPLYLVYAFVKRQFRLLAVAATTMVLLNIGPLLWTGRDPVQTMGKWLQVLGQFQGAGTPNDPSPEKTVAAYLLHLQPLVFRVFGSHSLVSELTADFLILSFLALTFWLIWRSRAAQDNLFLDFSLISALSLVSMYHQSYDVFLLFPGIVSLYLHAHRQTAPRTRLAWLALTWALALGLMLPGDFFTHDVISVLPGLAGQPWWRIIEPHQAWAAVIVLVALLTIKATALIHKPERSPLFNERSAADPGLTLSA